MMVNVNLMLLMVLLWAGTLSVASPNRHSYMPKTFWGTRYCDKYILPLDSMWIPRASCGDNKRYACQPGYNSQVQTTCKHGDWILEPVCQAVGCPQGENITGSEDLTESRLFNEEFIFNCSIRIIDYSFTGALTCGENGVWKVKEACPEELYTSVKPYGRNQEPNCAEQCANETICGFFEAIGNECFLYAKPIIFFSSDIGTISECVQLCKNDTRCVSISFQYTCGLYSVNSSTVADVFKPEARARGILLDIYRLLQ